MSKYTETKKVGRPKKEPGKNKQMPRSVDRHCKICELLKKRPYTVKEIAEETNIPRQRVNEIKNYLIDSGEIKKIENKFVDKDYEMIEEKIREKLKETRQIRKGGLLADKPRAGQTFKEEFLKIIDKERMKQIANILGEKCNDEFEKAFMKVCRKEGLRIHNLN